MKNVQLAGTQLLSTALGFGCSALMGGKTEDESLRLLETAFDCGVRYFDVARMYGYGQAERVVGRFAKGKRDQLVLATKFGIEPMVPAAGLSGLRTVARKLMRLSPKFRTAIGRGARAMMSKPRFNPESAQRSLETSLRLLDTDWVDVFLLHECSSQEANSPELLEFLRGAVQQGRIRAFGVGTNVTEAQVICRECPEIAQVAQFQNSVVVRSLESVRAPLAAITHGAVAAGYAALTTYLRAEPFKARQWSEELGTDCSDSRVIAALMLSYAVEDNKTGPVLFSSNAVARIQENTRTIREAEFSAEQTQKFASLVLEAGIAAT